MARVDIIMPQMGESIAEGTLSKWLKKVGDEVKRDEPIFEISTDKVDAEIPAPAAGVLAEIIVKEGETVAVQTVVARLETEKGAGGRREAAAAGGNAGSGTGAGRSRAPLTPMLRRGRRCPQQRLRRRQPLRRRRRHGISQRPPRHARFARRKRKFVRGSRSHEILAARTKNRRGAWRRTSLRSRERESPVA